MLLEIHDPVGHLQIGDVEDLARFAKGRRIFAMRIDHDDVAFGRGLADAMEDQRRARGFARPGRSEQGEMLAQQRIDIEACANIPGRIDGADLDRTAPVAGIDLAQILRGGGIDHRARNGIAGNAAPETVELAGELLLLALAEKIDVRDDGTGGAAILALVAHAGEEPAIADANLDLAADLPGHGDRRIGIVDAFGEALGVDGDLRSRPGDFEHHADGKRGICSGIRPGCPAGTIGFLTSGWLGPVTGCALGRLYRRARWLLFGVDLAQAIAERGRARGIAAIVELLHPRRVEHPKIAPAHIRHYSSALACARLERSLCDASG